MCGFSSFLFTGKSLWLAMESKNAFLNAAQNLAHRGNEKMRTSFFPNLFLAHFRLAFQDPGLNIQPLMSFDRKWIILYNGEIYNYKELKTQIETFSQVPFQTHGDTEVILNGFLAYGTNIASKLEGEYSFVIFSTDGNEAFAFRDPCGVKPLFVAVENLDTDPFSIAHEEYQFKTNSLQFSSEIKGLAVQKKWHRQGFLRQAVGLYEPIRTPFEHIIQIPQNSYLHAIKNGDHFSVTLKLNPAAPRDLSSHGFAIPSRGLTAGSILKPTFEFENIMRDSVVQRTLSDVELGVYLSGGIDSKIVAYELAQHYKTRKTKDRLKSFTIGFENQDYDESAEALSFAKKMDFNFQLIKVTNFDLQYAYPHAVYHSENVQPYTNGAAKWWLSNFTSQHVSGVLTGDGADELLCGYPSFRYANWWKFVMRNGQHDLGTSWRDFVYQKKFNFHKENPWLAGSSHLGTGSDFVQSLSLWGVPHPLFDEIKSIACALLGEHEGIDFLKNQKESIKSWFAFGLSDDPTFLTDSENTLLLWQNYFFKTHLPVQVLNWVGDRMEMANTLEGRTPFLSRKMRDFIRNQPDVNLVRGFQEKSILRRAYKNKIEKATATPKKQFNAPFLYPQGNKNWEQEILDRVSSSNLLEKNQISYLIQRSVKNQNSQPSYSKTYDQSALQMLSSFAILDHSLLNETRPTRDFEYEKRVLNKGKKV